MSVLHKPPEVIGHRRLSFTSVFCSQKHSALGLSDIHSNILTSQSALKKKLYRKASGQNNDDKFKVARSSHGEGYQKRKPGVQS